MTSRGPTRVSATASAILVVAAAATIADALPDRNSSIRRLEVYQLLRLGWKSDPVTGDAIATKIEAVSVNAPICRFGAGEIGPSPRRDGSAKG